MSRHIAIIEDHQPLAEILCRILTREGYTPAVISNLHELEQFAGHQPIDLLISDVHVPSVNSDELAHWLGAQPHDARPQLMMISGDLASPASQALRSYTAACLQKPFNMNDFMIHVQALLADSANNLRANELGR